MTEDTSLPSADDALEPADDDFQTTQPAPLPEDNNTPAAPADDVGSGVAALPADHPLTDSELDTHEVYDGGIAGATDINAHFERDEQED